MAVQPGQAITADEMNSKSTYDDLSTLASSMDAKLENTNTYLDILLRGIIEVSDLLDNLVFVGTDAQWEALSSDEKSKYILRGVPK